MPHLIYFYEVSRIIMVSNKGGILIYIFVDRIIFLVIELVIFLVVNHIFTSHSHHIFFIPLSV